MPNTAISDTAVAAAIREIAIQRGCTKSFCPSEAARALNGEWRELMPDIRRVAARLSDIEALQKGVVVDPLNARGPIRLRLCASHKPQASD